MEINVKEKNNVSTVESQVSLNVEKPKRVLHFSDGILEEFLEDNEFDEKVENDDITNNVIEKEMKWGPWFLHKTMKTSKKILDGCDYIGESLASLLGITTPKYALEIGEFERSCKEDKEIAERENLEYASWQETKHLNSTEPITRELTSREERF